MNDDIVTRLRGQRTNSVLCDEAADEIEQLRNDMAYQARVIIRHYGQFRQLHKEIERLRKEVSKWATTPPNRMVCATHGEMFMCFDDFMGGVYWCDGCKDD